MSKNVEPTADLPESEPPQGNRPEAPAASQNDPNADPQTKPAQDTK